MKQVNLPLVAMTESKKGRPLKRPLGMRWGFDGDDRCRDYASLWPPVSGQIDCYSISDGMKVLGERRAADGHQIRLEVDPP
jgi:hypothetical protein